MYLNIVRELKKNMEHAGDTNYDLCTRNNPRRFGKRTRRLINQRTRGDNPNYVIVKIG